MSTRSITFVVRARNEARDTLRAIGLDFRAQAQLAAEAAQMVSREISRSTAGMELLENRSQATQGRLNAVNAEIRETATVAMAADRALTGLTLALANVGTQIRAGLPSLKQFETARERLGQIAAAGSAFAPPPPPAPNPNLVRALGQDTPAPVPEGPRRNVQSPLAAQLQLPSTAFLDEMTKKANNAVVVYRKALETLETLGTKLGKAATSFNTVSQATLEMRAAIGGTADNIRPVSAALREVQSAAQAASQAISALIATSGRLAVRGAAPNVANAAAQAVAAAAVPNPRTQPQAAQAPPVQTSSIGNRTAEVMERVTRATTEAGRAFNLLLALVTSYNARAAVAATSTASIATGFTQVGRAADAAKASVAALVAQMAAVDLDSLRSTARPQQAAPTQPAAQSPVPNAPSMSQQTAQVVRESSTAVKNIQALGEALERVIARLAVFRISMSAASQAMGNFGLASVGAVSGANDFAASLAAVRSAADAAGVAVATLNTQARNFGGRPLQAAMRTMQTGNANAATGTTTPTQAGTSAQSLQNVAAAAQQSISALQALSAALPAIGTALNGIAPGFNAVSTEVKQFRTEAQSTTTAVNALQAALTRLNPGAVVNMMAAIRQAAAQAQQAGALVSQATAGMPAPPPPVTAPRAPSSPATATGPMGPAGGAAASATAAVGQASASAAPQITTVAQAATRAARGFNEMKQGGNSAYGALNDLGFQAFILQSTLMSLSSITGFAFAIREIAELDKAMAELRATTQASAEQMERFRALTTETSRASNFSETDAAKGLIELAKAGFNAEQAMIALRPAMNLANAGGLEMARSTEILVNIMQTYGATAQQTAQISDVLVAAANASTTSVSNLSTALMYAGPTAAGLRVSLEETAAAIATLAQNGIDGQKAGSGLRAAMSVLVSPTEEAQKVFQRLGISLREIDPSRVGLIGSFERLARANLSVSDASRIFGRETQNVVMIMQRLASAGGGEYKRILEEILTSMGEAERVASQRLDNLSDDFKKFRNSLSRGATAIGDSGLTASLRELVQIATMVSEALQGITPPANRLGQTAANIASTIRTIATAVNEWVQNFGALTATLAVAGRAFATFAAAASPVGRVVALVIGLGSLAVSLGAQFGVLGDNVTSFVRSISGWEAALAGLFIFFRASPFGVFIRGLLVATAYAVTFREEAGGAITAAATAIGQAMDDAVAAFYRLFPRFDEFAAKARSAVETALASIRSFSDTAGPMIGQAVDSMIAAAATLGEVFAALTGVFEPVIGVLGDVATAGDGTALALVGLALAVPTLGRLGAAIAGLAGGGMILATLSRGFGLVMTAIRVLVSTNPLGLFIQAVLLGISLVITYWDDIAPAIRRAARAIADAFQSMADRADIIMRSFRDAIAGYWQSIVDVAVKGAAALRGVLGNTDIRMGLAGSPQDRRVIQAMDSEDRIRSRETEMAQEMARMRQQIAELRARGVEPATPGPYTTGPDTLARVRRGDMRGISEDRQLTAMTLLVRAQETELERMKEAHERAFRDVEQAEIESMRRRGNSYQEFRESLNRMWSGDGSFGQLFSAAMERNSSDAARQAQAIADQAAELRELEQQAIRTAERLAAARAAASALPEEDPNRELPDPILRGAREAAQAEVTRLEGEQARVAQRSEQASAHLLQLSENYSDAVRRSGNTTGAALEATAQTIADAALYVERLMGTLGQTPTPAAGADPPAPSTGTTVPGTPVTRSNFREQAEAAAARVRAIIPPAPTQPPAAPGTTPPGTPPGQIRLNVPPNNGLTDTGRGAGQFDDSVLRLVRRYAPALRTAVESEGNTAILNQLGGMNPQELQRRYRLKPEDVTMIQERVRELEGDPYRAVTEFTEAQDRAARIARMPGTRRDREVEGQVGDVQRRLRDQGIDVDSFRRQRDSAEQAGDLPRVAALTERIAEAEGKLAEARRAAGAAFDAQAMQRFNEQMEETNRGYSTELQLLGLGGVARERRQVALQAENQLRRDGVTDAETLARAAQQATEAFDKFAQAREAVQGDPFAGFMRGLQNYAKEVGDLATTAERGMQRMLGAVEDALVDMVVTGKANFADLAKSISAELARIAIRAMIIRPLLGAMGIPTAHTGGIVGAPGPNPSRMVRTATQAVSTSNAIRRHWGGMSGLSSNETPIIAKKGEAIFPTVRLPDGQFGIRAEMPERRAEDMAEARSNPMVAGGGGPVHIENHIEVNISAADAQGVASGDPEAMKRLGDLIGNIVTQRVNEQLAQAMRPGGRLNQGR